MIDRTGADAVEFRDIPEGGREPVLEEAHRVLMVKDLYADGWSYRLIAQALGMTYEDARSALMTPYS